MQRFFAGLVGLVFVLMAMAGCSYVSTNSKFENQKQAWGDVENVYQTRNDKIPNLVSVTKGYAEHEKSIWEAFANARARVDSAKAKYDANKNDPKARSEYDQANVQLSTAVMPILTLQERYPELKADKTFMRLFDEISSTENTIRTERRRFNEAVSSYNKSVALGGGLFGFSKEEYFKADAGASKAPKVEF